MRFPHDLASTHVRTKDGFKVIQVDTQKAHYYNIPWRTLGRFGKRKFENLIVNGNLPDRVKIIYA